MSASEQREFIAQHPELAHQAQYQIAIDTMEIQNAPSWEDLTEEYRKELRQGHYRLWSAIHAWAETLRKN